MNANIENIYTLLKTFLPYAKDIMPNSKFSEQIPQLQNIVDVVENMGGVSALSSITNLFSGTKENSPAYAEANKSNATISDASPKVFNLNDKSFKIDDLKRIN